MVILERNGFWLSSKIPFRMNPTIVKISEEQKENKGTYRQIDKAFDLEVQYFSIYNDAWENNWGFVPKEFLHGKRDCG